MNPTTENRGAASEAAVETALKTLKEDPRYGLTSMIRGVVQAERNSRLDRSHVDFLVTLGDRSTEPIQVPIQVKSSERGRRKFERFCRWRGLEIPVIVVRAGEAMESIARRIARKLLEMYRKIRRRLEWIAHLNRERRAKRERKAFLRFHPARMCH